MYYSAIKGNHPTYPNTDEFHKHYTKWRELDTKDYIYMMFYTRQNYSDGELSFSGLRREGLMAKGNQGSFGVMEMFYILINIVVTWLQTSIRPHHTIPWKMDNFYCYCTLIQLIEKKTKIFFLSLLVLTTSRGFRISFFLISLHPLPPDYLIINSLPSSRKTLCFSFFRPLDCIFRDQMAHHWANGEQGARN